MTTRTISYPAGPVPADRVWLGPGRPDAITWRWGSRALAVLSGLLVAFTSMGEIDRRMGRSGERPDTTGCRPGLRARTRAYLVGRACPPEGFVETMGYEPVLVQTANGWRFTKPAWANGHCTGPIGNRGPFWDFTAACQTHDYGYDLVRFGIGDRGEADRLLYADMLASCEGQDGLNGLGCRTIAASARSVLKVGEVMEMGPPPGSARPTTADAATIPA